MKQYEMTLCVIVEANSEEDARMKLEDRLFDDQDIIHDSLAWDCEEYDE